MLRRRPIFGYVSIAVMFASLMGLVAFFSDGQRIVPHEDHFAVALEAFSEVFGAIIFFTLGICFAVLAAIIGLIRREPRLVSAIGLSLSLLILLVLGVSFLARS